MYRKILLVAMVAFALAWQFPNQANAQQQSLNLWAAISVSDPLFRESWTKDLTIHFTLVNDGNEIIDPKIESSKIIINGEALESSGFIFSNGPRSKNWNALAPRDALRFSIGLNEYFKKPGIYKVSWKGQNFEAPQITFRVMPSKSNR
ncbi:MAG TPA: hypothetical protein VFQ47_01740 [Nitrososphaera sp.]|jgi:archaellum component FlaG (FlaF/FlaG flagellin family)|nr:hypothetical protein [Nitrososphaera sp.]